MPLVRQQRLHAGEAADPVNPAILIGDWVAGLPDAPASELRGEGAERIALCAMSRTSCVEIIVPVDALDDVLPFALEDLAARLEGQGALRWFWRLA